MQEDELPPFYRRDMDADLAKIAQDAELEAEGRGRRAKNDIKYTDGLTDDQWLTAMDADDDDVDEAADRKRARASRKAERKRMNEMLGQAEAEGKPLDAGKLMEEGLAVPPKPAKKRGRPSVSATPSIMGDDTPAVSDDASIWGRMLMFRSEGRRIPMSHQARRLRSCGNCSMIPMRKSRLWARI